MQTRNILVIHPLTTVTKVAVYSGTNLVLLNQIKHKDEELAKFKKVSDQTAFRTEKIINDLMEDEIDLGFIKVVVARGGLIKPVKSGVFAVNEAMVNDLKKGVSGTHAANLGGLIAAELVKKMPHAKAYVADPVVVDELDDIARVSGHPLFTRKSVFHALNHKVAGRSYAKTIHKSYEDLKLIIAHVGSGGASIAAHKFGKVVDVNQAFDGCGPFALERAGSLPGGDLVRACFSGKYSEAELIGMITENGGLASYIGTKNLSEIERKILNGDKEVEFYLDAMAYQFAKEIGGLYTIFDGDPDAIILIGDIFQSKIFTEMLTRRIEKIGKIIVFPGVNDMDALAMNGDLILKNEIPVIAYT